MAAIIKKTVVSYLPKDCLKRKKISSVDNTVALFAMNSNMISRFVFCALLQI